MASMKIIIVVALVVLYHSGAILSVLEIPENCQGKQFCDEQSAHYNKYKENFEKIFPNITKIWSSGDNDMPLEDPLTKPSGSNCASISKVIKPYFAVQPNATTHIIVQTQYYEQKIKTVECRSSQANADLDSDKCFQELSTQGRCHTKRTAIILYAYNNEKDRIERISFDVPVCCFCSIPS